MPRLDDRAQHFKCGFDAESGFGRFFQIGEPLLEPGEFLAGASKHRALHVEFFSRHEIKTIEGGSEQRTKILFHITCRTVGGQRSDTRAKVIEKFLVGKRIRHDVEQSITRRPTPPFFPEPAISNPHRPLLVRTTNGGLISVHHAVGVLLAGHKTFTLSID
jgi:hypothetical protein